MIENTPDSTQRPPPATFGLRLLARLADLLPLNLLQLALLCLWAVGDALGLPGPALAWTLLALYLLAFVGYFAVWSAHGRQTWGYRLAGLQLRTVRGETVSGGRSPGRAALDFVFFCLLQYGVGLLDYLPVALTRSKQALHDRLTRTQVVRVAAPRPGVLALAAVLSIAVPFIGIFLLLRPFVMQAYYIPSPSMEPTLGRDSRFLVNKLSYRLHAPRPGEVVAFEAPEAAMSGRPTFLKRVLGVPGDVVQTVRGRVLVDGVETTTRSCATGWPRPGTSARTPWRMTWICRPRTMSSSSPAACWPTAGS